mgnify:CR=1 FL=1
MPSTQADLDAALATLATAISDLATRIGGLTVDNFDTEIARIPAGAAALGAMVPSHGP